MRLTAILCAALLAGCGTTKQFDFPKGMESTCHHARNEAKRLIEARGVPLHGDPPCTVKLRTGEKKVGDAWTWSEPALGGLYVGGTSSGKVQTLASDPATGAVYFPALLHEMGHHWMIACYADWGHDQRFKNDFWMWRNTVTSARVLGVNRMLGEAEPVGPSVFKAVHYDVIEEGGQ
jgi:hypothetical protein